VSPVQAVGNVLVGIAVLLAIGVLVVYLGLRKAIATRRLLAAYAVTRSWRYEREQPLLVGRFSGPPFGIGESRRAYNALFGTHRGRALVAFDYEYETKKIDGKQTETHVFSVPAGRLAVRAGLDADGGAGAADAGADRRDHRGDGRHHRPGAGVRVAAAEGTGMNLLAWLLIGLAGVLVVSLIVSHNRFVGQRTLADESWGDIDVELSRRHDLIPNLVATVHGYADHERELLEQLVRAGSGPGRGLPGPQGEHGLPGSAAPADSDRGPDRGGAAFLQRQRALVQHAGADVPVEPGGGGVPVQGAGLLRAE
jgi:hypothetical protein